MRASLTTEIYIFVVQKKEKLKGFETGKFIVGWDWKTLFRSATQARSSFCGVRLVNQKRAMVLWPGSHRVRHGYRWQCQCTGWVDAE